MAAEATVQTNCENRKIPNPSLTVSKAAKVRILVIQRLKSRAFFTIINYGKGSCAVMILTETISRNLQPLL